MKAGILFLAIFFSSPWLFAINNKQLAREMTPLIEKMDPRDPTKLTMVLRLADLWFEAAVEVDQNTKFDAQSQKEISEIQRRAIALYESALTGLGGAVPKPKLEDRYRIDFQLARLYVDQGKPALAENKWRELVQQNLVKQIQREAALRLAEKLEQSQQRSDLEKAGKYYQLAIATCGSPDLCSYIEYRQGWIFYRLGKSEEAIENLSRSLAKSDASSLDEILQDLSLFLAHSSWPATKAISFLEQLGKAHKRSRLIENLSASYFSANQLASYDQTLRYLHRKEPRLDYLISILDFAETKGDPELTRKILSELETAFKNQMSFSTPEKKEESGKILFRLVFQWDEQRRTRPEIFSDLVKRGAIVYTQAYPSGPEFDKMVDGWLVVETRPEAKLKQVQAWRLQQESLAQTKQVFRLRQIELTLHQQMKNWNEVVSTVDFLLLHSPSSQKRELTYHKAKALYELKNYTPALSLFQKLAEPTESKPDSYAVFSQNLTLDILAQQKQYDQVLTQAQLWVGNDKLRRLVSGDKKMEKELEDMAVISRKAAFSKAASSQSVESLRSFKEFCFSNQFLPQSCANALSLAAQLHDQKTTIEILKHQGKTAELADELEFAGYFSESAQEREKLLAKGVPTSTVLLRIALLYELGGHLEARNRVLNQLISQVLNSSKPLDQSEERLIFLTLKEASLLSPKLMTGPWSEEVMLELASVIEAQGNGNAQSYKLLLKTCRDLGPSWEKIQLDHLKNLNQIQDKISIVGRNSERNFERKMTSLKTLSEAAQCYLKGARNRENRMIVMSSLSRAYNDFSVKIKSVPLPEDLDAETLAQAKEKIVSMATPFDELSATWLSQAKSELTQFPIIERERLEQKYIVEKRNFDFQVQPRAPETKISYSWDNLLKELQKNPYDEINLEKLKAHFVEKGNQRLSSYFEGRLKTSGVE